MPKCPGQDQQYWKPEDIYDIICPTCGFEIEFWKDEPWHHCPKCEQLVKNPRIDMGCSKWCTHGKACITGIEKS